MRINIDYDLGWLLPRKLYKEELESFWPTQHWDHWLRSTQVHKGREIAYPEIPRSFHNGIKGTFMNLETHNKYFRDIDYNTDVNIQWKDAHQVIHPISPPPYIQLSNEVYEKRIESLIQSCHHIESMEDLASIEGNHADNNQYVHLYCFIRRISL